MSNQVHLLKTKSNYFEDILFHNKNFEVRRNDRNFKKNDIIILSDFNTEFQKHQGEFLICEIDYLFDDAQYCKTGYVILGIKFFSSFRYLPILIKPKVDELLKEYKLLEQNLVFPKYRI